MLGGDLLSLFVEPLEQLGLDYMVTGSVASMLYGEPRLTNDVDLVLDLSPSDAPRLRAAFSGSDFYCPPEDEIRLEAERATRGHINILHIPTALKADVYFAGDDWLHRWALPRCRRLDVETRSIRLSVDDPIQEPDALRRSDGQSVFSIPGVDWYTSSRILDAEQRIVANAGRTDGRAVDPSVVDLARLEALANGTQLTPGQSELVRDMACSGRRVQLAIAPAGTGKTTAMRVLGSAWTESGGTVIGLAPSAAAAKALADQLEVPCDTLAKLTWSLDHPEQPTPAWMAAIGPKSLVIIDEAGMADTLSLDRAIAEVMIRGGSVRLIGDDRQLSAIGAGGVLRDIEAEHGACRLTEVLRFDDPAEAEASRALREGRAEALGYYLDHNRIHVGDLVTMAHAVLDAWAHDRADGLDALMLAPTRELVTQLNRLAQQRHHEGHTMLGRGAGLATGNIAVAGDLVITRHNDRRLPVGSRDWVKNGDRWRVASVAADGSLRVQSLRSKHAVTLPADYVREWVDLGYATTIHGAQGLTADTMHGLTIGEESREQLYTMLTRGRQANHVYLQVVGDGDPHGLAHTDSVYLLSGVERLERILARDDAPLSATTELREQDNPARLLAPAVARYTDALGVAAEQVVGAEAVRRLDDEADQVVLWLTECPAWETLRADLLGLAADGHDPGALLRQAANMDELDTARDPAAVLDYRLQFLVPEKTPGPLPWLRGIPSRVAQDEVWGPYLQARATRIEGLADAVRGEVRSHSLPPNWLGQMSISPRMFENGVLIGDIAVWRAVMDVPASDARATGAPAVGDAAARWQRDLDARLDRALGAGEWSRLLPNLDPVLARDPERLVIARRLHGLAEKGYDVAQLVEGALAEGPLPDERAASALWWRVAGTGDVRLGWPPTSTKEVWETVTPPPRRRPEHGHMPGYGHNRDRHGPSIGF